MNEAEAERPRDLNHVNHNIRSSLYMVKGLLEEHLEHLAIAAHLAESGNESQTQSVLKQSTREINSVLAKLARLNRLHPHLSKAGTRVSIAVKTVLRRLIDALKDESYLDHVVLIDSVSSSLPQIYVNQADLEEVFFNLIVNAVQASGDGGQIIIEGSTQADPFPHVAILFRDNGRGIPEEALPHVFEPFVTGRVQNGGNGFGLYIVKQLVERNGGQISVESRRLFGTAFTIVFPVAPNTP